MGKYYRTRRDYWNFFLQEPDAVKIINPVKIQSEMQYLFRKYVDVVNIETSTYCNRKCTYCPISSVERNQSYIDDWLIKKGIDELSTVGYQNRIALNLYNEPLYDENLFSHIELIRKKLPDCYIQLNSNGDKMDKDMIIHLKKSGLNQMLITLHTGNKQYEDEDRKQDVRKFLKRIGLSQLYESMEIIPNKNITIDKTVDNLHLLICCNNWEQFGNDRGGFIKKLSNLGRNEPCNNPFREVCIACNGDFKPCCNIYFDMDDDYGNFADTSILDFYFSDKMVKFRRDLLDFSKKHRKCKTCNTEDNADPESDRIRKYMLK